MQTLSAATRSSWARIRFGVAAATLLAVASVVAIADGTAPPKTAKTGKKPEAKVKQLSGGDLYQIHCNRCHSERYATERTAKEWKTLMLHMRVRANLPADQAKAILKYLQEDSGK